MSGPPKKEGRETDLKHGHLFFGVEGKIKKRSEHFSMIISHSLNVDMAETTLISPLPPVSNLRSRKISAIVPFF